MSCAPSTCLLRFPEILEGWIYLVRVRAFISYSFLSSQQKVTGDLAMQLTMTILCMASGLAAWSEVRLLTMKVQYMASRAAAWSEVRSLPGKAFSPGTDELS